MALIIRKTSQDSGSSGFATTLNFTWPTTPTSGNALIVSGFGNNNNTITLSDSGSNTGWTSTNFTFDLRQLYIFYKISDGTEAIITVAQSGSGAMATHGYEYQNIANPIVTDTSQTSQATTVTTLQAGTLTNTNPVDLIFTSWGSASAMSSYSVSSPFKLLKQDARLADSELIVTVKSGYSPILSWSGSATTGSLIIAFKGLQVQGASDSGANFNVPGHVIVGDGMSRSEVAN